MTNQQLDVLYTERVNRLAPFIRTIPDDDMAQEARMGIFKALKKDPGANNTYLKQGARWQMSNSSRKGKSVDNGWKRDQVKMLHYDTAEADGIFSFIFKNRMNIPLDELVNDKIGMDNFFSQLTRREKDFVGRKLDGWSNMRIMKELRMSYPRLRELMDDIRFKINQTFAEEVL